MANAPAPAPEQRQISIQAVKKVCADLGEAHLMNADLTYRLAVVTQERDALLREVERLKAPPVVSPMAAALARRRAKGDDDTPPESPEWTEPTEGEAQHG